MSAEQLFRDGKLAEAVSAVTAQVKSSPTQADHRWLLATLLCYTGDLERADIQLETLAAQQPQLAVTVAEFRQLIRGEQWRRQVFSDGRAPEFVDQVDEEARTRLQAAIATREGRLGDAKTLLDRAEQLRPPLAGKSTGTSGIVEAFDDFRDLDDLLGSVLEVVTSNGKYFWVPFAKIEFLEFQPPKHPRDWFWRPCHLIVRGGTDGQVHVPTLYPGSHTAGEESIRLGRETTWSSDDNAPIRGSGHKLFLVGDHDEPLIKLKTLEFATP